MHSLNNPANIKLWKTIRRGHCFRWRIEDVISRLNLPPDRRRRLLALHGIGGHCLGLPASDIDARIRSTEILYQTIGDYLKYEVDPNDVRLITPVCDTGHTGDCAPHLRLKTFVGKTYRQIHDMKLNAICSIEIQVLTNYPEVGRNLLMLHPHGLLWGDVSTEVVQEAICKANNSRAWKNSFDATPIDLRPPDPQVGGIQGWACYMSELPDYAKKPVENEAGEIRFANHVSHYPDALKLRIMEGLSYFSIRDLVFGVGDGKYVRREWISELHAWDKERSLLVDPEPEFDIAEVWNDLPSFYYRRHRYRPYRLN